MDFNITVDKLIVKMEGSSEFGAHLQQRVFRMMMFTCFKECITDFDTKEMDLAEKTCLARCTATQTTAMNLEESAMTEHTRKYEAMGKQSPLFF